MNTKNFLQFRDDLRRYQNDFTNYTNKIFRSFDKYLSEVLKDGINPDSDPFLKGFRDILKNWRTHDSKDQAEVMKNTLLDPLKSHCKEYLKNSNTALYLDYISNANIAYNDIENIRKVYSNFLSESKNRLDTFIKELSESINYYYK